MEKNSLFDDGEIVFGSSDTAKSQAIRRAIKAKRLRKLIPRVYTTNLDDSPETIIRRNLYLILGELFPGAILSHRTALEGGPTPEGLIILTYKYNKKIEFPGITIRLIEGSPAQPRDTRFMGKLFIASRARALLENLEPTRGQAPKTLSQEAIEDHLDKICRIHGTEELNILREQARELAPELKLKQEYKLLGKLIGAILNTRTDISLNSKTAQARAQGKPYDLPCIELLAELTAKLTAAILPKISEKKLSGKALQNLAFFEAYFSNYIEGTEFEVEEAADIVFHNKFIPNRPEDVHDIVGTYQIVNNISEMKKTPNSSDQLIQLLKKRHQLLMSVRRDKHPGEFKIITNRVGNTIFVQPDLVIGTLEKSYELYQSLQKGLKRAIFIMFLVSEIHPFDDGNGRIARIMMNAELVSANEGRIIIPTVYREDYLLTLRRLSRSHDAEPYIHMLTRAQEFTASVDFTNYQRALKNLQKANAFMQSFEGKLIWDDKK